MKTIIATIVDDPRFSMLASIIKSDGLAVTLIGEGPHTLFAPTDDAFAKIDSEALKLMVSDKEKLGRVLNYHVVSGKIMSNTFSAINKTHTLQGNEIHIRSDHGVTINDANLIMADIECSNGVIHAIDSVLTP